MDSPDRWERLEELFVELVDLPSVDFDARIAQLCVEDSDLVDEVVEMVRRDKDGDVLILRTIKMVLADLLTSLKYSPDEGPTR